MAELEDINEVPASIPEAQAKKKFLSREGVEFVYLGQGLMFVPPESAVAPYNEYLVRQGLNAKDYPLNLIRRAGKDDEVYNSHRLEELWRADVGRQYDMPRGVREPKGFQSYIYDEISGETIEHLFQIDGKSIATMQANNLQEGLGHIRSIIAGLREEPVSRIVLPEQFIYPGHGKDFVNTVTKNNRDFEVVKIPEVQADGSQDLLAARNKFERIRQDGRIGFVIDQPSNNNSSGYDRDPKLNEKYVMLLKEYEGTIFYVGDIAYKGLKEDIVEPYPLMQEMIKQDLTAFWYFSPTKIGDYRKEPSFMSMVFATPGKFANTQKLKEGFGAHNRGAGIGCTSSGAEMMNTLSKDAEFLQEVRVLRQYLKYVLSSLGSDTNGIFREVDAEVAKRLNEGMVQAVTVKTRENIWPLGDPEKLKIYKKALES